MESQFSQEDIKKEPAPLRRLAVAEKPGGSQESGFRKDTGLVRDGKSFFYSPLQQDL